MLTVYKNEEELGAAIKEAGGRPAVSYFSISFPVDESGLDETTPVSTDSFIIKCLVKSCS